MEVIDLCGNTRMYSRPSPRMYCCAAIRPASIVCALTHPPSVAWRPNSPNTTVFPRVALPLIRPLWLFRCLTLLGINAIVFVLKHALVDPNLYTNMPMGSHGLDKTIVDFRPQSTQRN